MPKLWVFASGAEPCCKGSNHYRVAAHTHVTTHAACMNTTNSNQVESGLIVIVVAIVLATAMAFKLKG